MLNRHCGGFHRHRSPVGGVVLALFLLLMLAAWLGWGGALVVVLVAGVLVAAVRRERTRHGRRG